MTQERIAGQITEAGEILQGAQLAVIFPKRKNGFTKGWIAMSQSPYETLAKARLSGETHSVLCLLISRIDFENWININQTELANELEIKRPSFARALRVLIEKNLIIEGPKVGRNRTFRLNEHFGWKGSAANHKKALQERMKASNITGII